MKGSVPPLLGHFRPKKIGLDASLAEDDLLLDFGAISFFGQLVQALDLFESYTM